MLTCPIVYLRHVKILSYHMVRIYSKQHLTWLCQKCVLIHHQKMHYHIENVFCGFVNNIHVLISQVHNHISTVKILFLQYVFMCITLFRVVPCMEESLLIKINSVNCVRLPLIQKSQQKYLQENILS